MSHPVELKVATHATVKLSGLYVQVCSSSEPILHIVTTVQANLRKRQSVFETCRVRTMTHSLLLLLSLRTREKRERRSATCGVKTG